jgi:hypothetical protein
MRWFFTHYLSVEIDALFTRDSSGEPFPVLQKKARKVLFAQNLLKIEPFKLHIS